MKALAALLFLLSLPSLALAQSAQPMDPPINLSQPYCEGRGREDQNLILAQVFKMIARYHPGKG
jgi:hypothetical protein